MKKKYIIITIIIIVLLVLLCLFISSKNNKHSTINKIFTNKTYTEYKAGNRIHYNDEEWIVMYDSNEKEDYVTLICASILYLGEEDIDKVLDGIYETSELNEYLKTTYAKELGEDNLVEIHGYKVRLFNEDDMENLLTYEYVEAEDKYNILECPDYICLTNVSYATMIDTKEGDYNVDEISDIDDSYDYEIHLKYYNLYSTYETYQLESIVDDNTLFVRPVINLYKDSIEENNEK